MIGHGAAAAAGVGLDALVGEPPVRWHPVVWFGSTMARVEQVLYRDDRAAGIAHLAVGVGIGVAAGVARAVIETLAENTVDAVTAPLFWAAVGGAPAVLAHRAVNTLDAMVGHRTERYRRFGWAAARADDVANWVPARLTGLAVAAVRPSRAGAIARAVRRDAPAHPSPNGGVVEAAFAAALGVRLGGRNTYGDVVEDRGTLGTGPPPGSADIRAAIHLARSTVAMLAITTAVVSVAPR